MYESLKDNLTKKYYYKIINAADSKIYKELQKAKIEVKKQIQKDLDVPFYVEGTNTIN